MKYFFMNKIKLLKTLSVKILGTVYPVISFCFYFNLEGKRMNYLSNAKGFSIITKKCLKICARLKA